MGLVIDRPVCYVKGMSATDAAPGPRARLLAAADELFYEEGIHTVGIDRLLAHAGVAKASLYSTFGSKEALIGEYLQVRLQRRQQRIEAAMAKHHSPRGRLLAVFDALHERVAEKDFRGCAFARAAAEGQPNQRVESVCERARSWTRDLFLQLATECGVRKPERLARELVLLYDGAVVAAQMDGDLEAPRAAREAAALLLERAGASSRR
jgi:AcrR family transcriptional regulator